MMYDWKVPVKSPSVSLISHLVAPLTLSGGPAHLNHASLGWSLFVGLLLGCLTINVQYHTIPHELCRCQVKDVHGLQSFVSTHSEESDSLIFILCLQLQMLLTSAFSKENSAISSEECVLVFKLLTPATRRLTVNVPATRWRISGTHPLRQLSVLPH